MVFTNAVCTNCTLTLTRVVNKTVNISYSNGRLQLVLMVMATWSDTEVIKFNRTMGGGRHTTTAGGSKKKQVCV